MSSSPRIEVHADADALATAVAGELLTRIADVQAGGGVPQIMLTGGTIADKVHREVARLSPGTEVDWSQVVVWWGDERFVAPDSEDRNALQARRALLDHVGVDPAKVHEMPSTVDQPDPDAAAAAHADVVRDQLTADLDVVMLGLGPDGHIASLFPGFPQLDVTEVPVTGVTGSPKPPPERLSMTYPVINRARSLWFLVSSEGKAEAVARTLGGADHHEVPAAGAQGREETIWFLDRPAASRL